MSENIYLNPYVPTVKQTMFHQSIADEVLYGGAAGGGKSRAIVEDAFARCMWFKGCSCYLFRRTYPELEDTLIKEANRVVPKSLGKYNNTRHELVFENGSKMLFRHCAFESDMTDYQGAEIDFLYIDELTHFTKSIYDYLKSRLRTKNESGIQPCVRCSSNPGGVGHGWVKQYFVDIAPYNTLYKEKIWVQSRNHYEVVTRQYIPALVTDNPHINDRYVLELEKKPEALRNALLHGNWDAFEGQVFTEFRNNPDHYVDRHNTHVIDPFEIPVSWPRYVGYDWGFSRPFAVLWMAVSPDNTIYVYREWYGSPDHSNTGLKLPAEAVADGIKRVEMREAQDGVRFIRYADPAIFDVSSGESVAEKMAKSPYNIAFMPGDHSRINGKMQVHSRLAFGEDGLPKLQIFNTCPDLIRTLETVPYSPIKVEDIDTNAEDHAYDALRMVLMAYPAPDRPMGRQTHIPSIDPLNQFKDGDYFG